MWAQEHFRLLPFRRMFFGGVISSAVAGLVVLEVSPCVQSLGEPIPPSKPLFDPRFVILGREYLPQLGKVYARAWNEGARALDAGSGISQAIDTVAKNWSDGRTDLYDTIITPEFDKILPETGRDEMITPAQCAAMAAAWRGFAVGLSP
jgi:hypothetical protein